MIVRALLVLVLLAPAARAAEPVELSVLSYNVHGLAAWMARDDPAGRTPQISHRINAYDVALIQEDWLFHEELVAQANHAIVERGNPSRFPWASWLPIWGGSGLTTLAAFDPGARTMSVREPYGLCAGWLSGANDCLGTKGFLLVRLRPAPGVEIDLYQTHLDAGGDESDQSTRIAQLERLAARIAVLSPDRALILAGDFNLNHAVDAQRLALDGFTRELGLVDSGAAREDVERWKRIDYIFYRPGGGLEIDVLASGQALEFEHEGVALSDHPAIFARFRLR